jgi:hypothetical protein
VEGAPAALLAFRQRLALRRSRRTACNKPAYYHVCPSISAPPPSQVEQERNKYPPQQVVGFRFTGMRVPQVRRLERPQSGSGSGAAEGQAPSPPPAPAGVKEHGRAFGYALDEASLHHAFYEYLHDGERLRLEVVPHLLGRLREIRAWFAAQAEFRFYGSSLLFLYDVDAPPEAPLVDLRMIDFAHVWPIPPPSSVSPEREGATDGVARGAGRDEGYLRGLDSVIGFLEALLLAHRTTAE